MQTTGGLIKRLPFLNEGCWILFRFAAGESWIIEVDRTFGWQGLCNKCMYSIFLFPGGRLNGRLCYG